jgi:hypothetical protein
MKKIFFLTLAVTFVLSQQLSFDLGITNEHYHPDIKEAKFPKSIGTRFQYELDDFFIFGLSARLESHKANITNDLIPHYASISPKWYDASYFVFDPHLGVRIYNDYKITFGMTYFSINTGNIRMADDTNTTLFEKTYGEYRLGVEREYSLLNQTFFVGIDLKKSLKANIKVDSTLEKHDKSHYFFGLNFGISFNLF